VAFFLFKKTLRRFENMDLNETVIDANAPTPSSDVDSDLLSSPDGTVPQGNTDGAQAGAGDDAAAAAAAAEAAAKTADAGKTADAAKGGEDVRFDQHPRFIELNNKVKSERDARIAAEAKVAIFEKSPLNPAFIPAAEGKPEFKDISSMSAEEIREWQEDDPKGFAENIRQQAVWEAKQSLKHESLRDQTVSGIEKTFSDYAASNPTFNDMWDSGEIEKFMNAHPGHNAISAHMAMTAAAGQTDVQKKIEEAVAKARKEEREKVTKDFQAKRNATVISSGAGATGRGAADGVDPALQNTKNFGGLTSVLADKLASRRRAAAG
jgi:hypothetical protein